MGEKKQTQTDREQATEQKILEAARVVFLRRGFAGSRMQEIADEAGMNKALLHYYFRNKEQLFETVFREAVMRLLPIVRTALVSENTLEEKIEQFVVHYLTVIADNPFVPGFLLHEITSNPERLPKLLPFDKIDLPQTFIQQFQEAIREGRIRPVPPRQLVASIIALCVFPFVAKPVLQFALNMPTEEDFRQFIEERKQTLVPFILNALRP
jgi:TetR/AcrR family transcriptional regulator